jgi:hypothetical protein
MTAKLEPRRDPADAQLYDHIGVILHGTRQIGAYMGVSPATIVRWRRSFRGREEPRLCFPAMLIPGRGRQWRMVTNTRLIARWMERWAEIDTGNAQARARWRRKPAKTKRLDETQTALVRPPVEGESRPSLREQLAKLTPAEQAWIIEHELTPTQRQQLGVRLTEMPAASPPLQLTASTEPCSCGVPSRCLVHNEPFEGERDQSVHADQPVNVRFLPEPLPPELPGPPASQPAPRRQSGIKRIEGCVCSTGLNCTVHD